jgi:hypothetical protein
MKALASRPDGIPYVNEISYLGDDVVRDGGDATTSWLLRREEGDVRKRASSRTRSVGSSKAGDRYGQASPLAVLGEG